MFSLTDRGPPIIFKTCKCNIQPFFGCKTGNRFGHIVGVNDLFSVFFTEVSTRPNNRRGPSAAHFNV